MPLFSVDIEKEYQGEYWTNRYIVQAADLNTANGDGGGIVALERTIHLTDVLFTRWRTSDLDPATDLYIINQINAQGLRTHATDILPLFNVARVDFSTGQGRPSRKYLRGVLVEADITFNTILAGTVTDLTTSYATPMKNTGYYVDVDGQVFTAVSVYPLVAMRQLRRGSKRRVTPIL